MRKLSRSWSAAIAALMGVGLGASHAQGAVLTRASVAPAPAGAAPAAVASTTVAVTTGDLAPAIGTSAAAVATGAVTPTAVATALAIADGSAKVKHSSPDAYALPNPVMPKLAPIGAALAKQHHLTHELAQRTTNYHHASASQCKNIELLATRLNGVVIQPGQTFSYYKVVGPYNAENGYHWGRAFSGDRIVPSMGGGVCQGASTLYSAVMRAGLPVVERHNHSLTVPYLPPGEDATVSGTYLNFKFRNNQPAPVMIAATTDHEKRYLTVALWGASPPPHITVHHEVLSRAAYRKVYKCDSKLSAGSEKVLFPGQAGGRIKTWVEVKTDKGVVNRPVSTDAYRPSPRVILRGCGGK